MNDSNHIYGIHAVAALLEQNPQSIQVLYMQRDRHDKRLHALEQAAQRAQSTVVPSSKEELDQMTDHARHQGVVAHCKKSVAATDLPQMLADLRPNAFFLILDEVQDPHNLGACLRSAAAAGVDAVIIPKDRAVGMTPTVRKVAVGAAEIVPLIQVTNLRRALESLQQAGVWVYGFAEQAEQTLYQADFTGSCALVLGNEEKGLRRLTRETCDHLVKVPTEHQLASLNVSVAAGVALFEVVRQRR